MVSLSDLAENGWFKSEESEEFLPWTSVVLQSSMVRGWAKVLRRRAVAHIGASRAARSRAVRLVRMAEHRSLVLSGESGGSSSISAESVARFLPESYHSDSGEDSEDEPLSRRVTTHSGFRPSTFKISTVSVESDEGECVSGEDSSESNESECEEASEVDSESESEDESEDELIYLGRESTMSNFRSQALLSRWVLPMAVAVDIWCLVTIREQLESLVCYSKVLHPGRWSVSARAVSVSCVILGSLFLFRVPSAHTVPACCFK